MDEPLPILCQATGQLTCTSLADSGVNDPFPNNTSDAFSNVFDTATDFSRVEYLGLSGIMLTTPPQQPARTLQSIAAVFDPSTTIQASSALTLSIVTPRRLITATMDAERIVINLDYDTLNTPQIGIGSIIRGPNDLAELQKLVSDTMAGSRQTPLMTVDPSSILSWITIGAPTSLNFEEKVCSGYIAAPGLGTAIYEANSFPAGAVLDILPSTTYTPAALTAATGFDFSGTWRIVHIGTSWSFSPATLNFNLVGTMDDMSTIPLGTYRITPRLDDWTGPPGASASPLPPGGRKWRWCIGGPNTLANKPVVPFTPVTWAFNQIGSTNAKDRYAKIENYYITWTTTSMAVGTDGQPGNWYNFYISYVGASQYSTVAALEPDAKKKKFVHRRLTPGGPYKGHAAQLAIAKPLSSSLYATPVDTYDNLLQILCNELETDRLAGSNASQVLALVPIDPSELITNGYLYIPIPVNEFVWRKLSDIHIKAISFELYNGAGAPPSYLENSAFVVTLQLRYK
jgi:hypothetical protein